MLGRGIQDWNNFRISFESDLVGYFFLCAIFALAGEMWKLKKWFSTFMIERTS
jgi:hypothetical protein